MTPTIGIILTLVLGVLILAAVFFLGEKARKADPHLLDVLDEADQVKGPAMTENDDRRFCPAVNSRNGWLCDFAAHPWQTHWSWVNGELKVWSAPTPSWENKPLNTEDPLRDAPEALKRNADWRTRADAHTTVPHYPGWTEKQVRNLYEQRWEKL